MLDGVSVEPENGVDRSATRRELPRRAFLAAGAATAAGFLTASCFDRRPERAAGWRVPGEDATHERTWMTWPSSNRIWGDHLLPKIQGDIARLAGEIARHEPVIMCADGSSAASQARAACGSLVAVIGSVPVDDCWMRDTGPLFRVNGAGAREAFGLNFNGWGDKQIHGNDRHVAERVADYAEVEFTKATVVGEGGGIEYDGDGTLIATESCWVNPNRNPGMAREEIEAELLSWFGARKLIWLPGVAGRDITDGHVDGTSRFVRPGVVMVQLPPPPRTDIWAEDARQQFEILSQSTDAQGRRLRVLTLEGPDTLPRWPKNRWETFLDSYVNWAVTNSAVITVEFGDIDKDAAAKAAIEAAFSDKKVVQLDLDQLHGEGGGGAHCVTMQEPSRPVEELAHS